mmetsp:Transcript_33643/g.52292  ORF Transcript_33643/g.52292 Transcript_33643/m.52292 type:complete len:103 (+) Transcript_33643:217-525(+)
MLKAVCLDKPNPLPNNVMQDGPIPLPNATNKFAAVNAAPRVSGGLTFNKHGRTLTDGNDAMHPPNMLYPIALYPCGLGNVEFNNPKNGKIPKNVDTAIYNGK